MATQFLASLPKVSKSTLPRDERTCAICLHPYGTEPSARGIKESPVRLPCNHILGSECISKWLSPTPSSGMHNSCPMCRHVFFRAGIDDREEREPPRTGDTNYELYFPIPRDHGGRIVVETLDIDDFSLLNREAYRQRRTTTPRIGAPVTEWRPIVDHIFRLDQERYLYQSYQTRGADLPDLPRGRVELSTHQADLLFEQMQRRGVLDQLWGQPFEFLGRGYPTRRQMWELIRDLGYGFGARYGAVEDEDRGVWTRTVWLPVDRHYPVLPRWLREPEWFSLW